MQPAQTFGRRGVAAAQPAQFAPRQALAPQPSQRAPGRETEALASAARAPSAKASSDRGVAWMMFSLEGRLSQGNYRLVRIVVNLSAFIVLWTIAQLARQHRSAQDLGLLMSLGLFELVTFPLWIWTTIAMQVKRWHDRDKSGVWMLIGFVPLIGSLWTLVELMFLQGTVGPNRFGPDPKGDPAAVFD